MKIFSEAKEISQKAWDSLSNMKFNKFGRAYLTKGKKHTIRIHENTYGHNIRSNK